MYKIDVILNDYDNRLMDMYDNLYTTTTIACYGNEWIVNEPSQTMEFKSYKSFIKFIEDEVKCALFNYAFHKELNEIVNI